MVLKDVNSFNAMLLNAIHSAYLVFLFIRVIDQYI